MWLLLTGGTCLTRKDHKRPPTDFATAFPNTWFLGGIICYHISNSFPMGAHKLTALPMSVLPNISTASKPKPQHRRNPHERDRRRRPSRNSYNTATRHGHRHVAIALGRVFDRHKLGPVSWGVLVRYRSIWYAADVVGWGRRTLGVGVRYWLDPTN